MKTNHRNYIDYLLGFSKSGNDEEIDFIEKEYLSYFQKFKIDNQKRHSLAMTILICFPLIIFLIPGIVNYDFPVNPRYILIAGMAIDLIFLFISMKIEQTYNKIIFMRYVRFYVFYSLIYFAFITSDIRSGYLSTAWIYKIGLYILVLQYFFLVYNPTILFITMIINNSLIYIYHEVINFDLFVLLFDLGVSCFFIFCLVFIKEWK